MRPNERVSGEGGRYRLPDRVVTDEHPLPSLTLADAIRVSSNIALVKFSARLEPDEQYGVLRGFGFGAPTGVEFPAESPGRLRPPADGRVQLGQPGDQLRAGGDADALAAAYEPSPTTECCCSQP